MKIILTGATGFLGSHILKGLEGNIEVVILKRSSSNDERILKYQSKYKFYDVDKVNLYEVFEREAKIDVIIHCATDYGRNIDNISKVFQSNVVFPLELLQTAVDFNTDTFINTDTFFSKTKFVRGYMQNYILTKNQFLEWGKLFSESEKINFINMRLEHIYGEGDDISKFIPFVMQSCLNNIDKIDLTTGEQLRDFIYVDDVIAAYLKVLSVHKQLKGYHEYGVGCGKSVSVKKFVSDIKDIVGSMTELNFGAIPHRENEILFSKADISNLRELGWFPKYDVKKGIKAYESKVKNI